MENPTQALEEARRAGIDLDLLDSNLALTYEERVLRHESAQELMWALKEAGAAYEKSARSAAEIRLFGRRCRVISLEDLIKAKEAMGREKDLLTAKELRAIAAKRRGS